MVNSGDLVLVCKYCWIRVKEAPEAEKVFGKGEFKPYVHAFTRDEQGNPTCNRVGLSEEDVEPLEEVTD